MFALQATLDSWPDIYEQATDVVSVSILMSAFSKHEVYCR